MVRREQDALQILKHNIICSDSVFDYHHAYMCYLKMIANTKRIGSKKSDKRMKEKDFKLIRHSLKGNDHDNPSYEGIKKGLILFRSKSKEIINE